MAHETLTTESGSIKMWTHGVPVEEQAKEQLKNVASLDVVQLPVAVMPDVHVGYGATIGSVIPTTGAVIPAAVGVDIGCGMCASMTSLTASDLPDGLVGVRRAIECAVPHGRTSGRRGRGGRDKGAWGDVPDGVASAWNQTLATEFKELSDKHRPLRNTNNLHHLGTLGTGNHFVEVCLDTEDRVWVMLHSGSRGVGNRIGTYFMDVAKKDMGIHIANLPDKDLAYLREGTEHFDDYVKAVGWAQRFARTNRAVMMRNTIDAMRRELGDFEADMVAVNCHHNYVSEETHFGQRVWVTRKGAVRAGLGDMGIIPGSMGAKSFIVRGKGNADSYCSCSHGAGRVMSRTKAKKMFTVEDQIRATEGVECRKDAGVIDEIPMAYKNIDAVMAAQTDLVDVVHTLRQVVCVKG